MPRFASAFLFLVVCSPALCQQPNRGTIEKIEGTPKFRLVVGDSEAKIPLVVNRNAKLTVDGKPGTFAGLVVGMQATYLTDARGNLLWLRAVTPKAKVERKPEFLPVAALEVGQVGRLDFQPLPGEAEPRTWLVVASVRGEKEALVTPIFVDRRKDKNGDEVGAFIQSKGTPFVVRGLPTKGLADGSKFPTRGKFSVSGTARIDKATVFVVEPAAEEKK